MDEPVVYFKPGCPFGIRLRTALTLHRVPHRSVRFRDDEDGAARVRDVNDGDEISPTVHIAGRWLTNPGWREVREATWRSALVAVAAASMLLASCGSDDSTPAAEAPDDRASTSVTSEAPATLEAPATSEAPAASPLEGTWRTEPITLRDAEATLRRQGLAKWIDKFHEIPPFSKVTVLALSIEGGQWNLYGESEGGREPIDYDAEYEIDGDTVTFHHSNGSNTHRWSVDGDTLTLEFVRGTLPPYEGIPDEVFQRALYMTEAFTRQD